MNKITDLIIDALNDEENYKFKINLIIAGLVSEESNDTPEKEKKCQEMLMEISKFANEYDGNKKGYMEYIKSTVGRCIHH